MAIGSMSSCGGPTTARLSIIFVLICALYFTRDFWLPVTPAVPVLHHTTPSKETSDATSDATPETPSIPQDTTIYTPHDEDCKSVPGADKVMVILKTGATEIYEKLPTHFVTLFRCTPHFLIFSDLAQSYSDYTIHDAIEPVSPKYKDSHEDFELYRKMQEYQREGQDMSKLKGDKGWNLDKWKFLPMLHKTYELSPDTIDWFVYIEADTSLSWTNLLQWLKTMDPRKEYYLGAQNVIGDTTFGHGGSGTAISRAAAEKFYNARLDMGAKKFDAKWEKLTGESCCGDEVVARALKAEADIPLTPAWPLFQGEKMNTIDWTATHWCTPPLTMHHVTAIEVDAQWQFHQQWVEDHVSDVESSSLHIPRVVTQSAPDGFTDMHTGLEHALPLPRPVRIPGGAPRHQAAQELEQPVAIDQVHRRLPAPRRRAEGRRRVGPARGLGEGKRQELRRLQRRLRTQGQGRLRPVDVGAGPLLLGSRGPHGQYG